LGYKTLTQQQQPGTQRVQALTDISILCNVVIATKHVHQMQICPRVHN